MNENRITIYYPNRPGFILYSNELRLLFQRLFDLHSTITVHDRETFEVTCNETVLHCSEPTDPVEIDKLQIITNLNKIVPFVREPSPDDLKGGKLKEQEIELEWRFSICSGE